ncbi:MAG: SGNH/GDSL hydrolase family protein [Acidobacteria bacterium]|nr:SGNH/GDSL hydrolase family protein [Acidobacteriota bacterium]
MVNGYPFTYEEGFVHQACELLRQRGLSVEPLREAPVKTTQFDRIAAVIKHGAPQAVVLQIGGLETVLLLEDVVRRRLGLAVPKREYSNHLHTSPFRGWKTHARWRVMVTAKRLADALLGHPIVDFAEYRRNLRRVLKLVRECTPGPVLTLGLFPSVDPVSRYYRKRLEPLFTEETERAGVAYFSTAAAWQAAGKPSDIFHDSLHLNVHGHQWLAPLVANALHECLRGHTAPMRAHTQASGG